MKSRPKNCQVMQQKFKSLLRFWNNKKNRSKWKCRRSNNGPRTRKNLAPLVAIIKQSFLWPPQQRHERLAKKLVIAMNKFFAGLLGAILKWKFCLTWDNSNATVESNILSWPCFEKRRSRSKWEKWERIFCEKFGRWDCDFWGWQCEYFVWENVLSIYECTYLCCVSSISLTSFQSKSRVGSEWRQWNVPNRSSRIFWEQKSTIPKSASFFSWMLKMNSCASSWQMIVTHLVQKENWRN